MSVQYNPKIVTANLLLGIDFANIRSYNPSSNANNIISILSTPYSNLKISVVNNTWVTIANGVVKFNRAPYANSAAEKAAGGGYLAMNPLPFPKLQYNTFYYNDHTFEVWVKLNAFGGSNWTAEETQSWIAGHKGYNQGWGILSGTVYYSIWNSNIAGQSPVFLTNGGDIDGNTWYQFAMTRKGNTWNCYVNGQLVESNTTFSPIPNTLGVSNSAALVIGAQGQLAANFTYYSTCTISNIKMYDRSLSGDEIEQNFSALRGRIGV